MVEEYQDLKQLCKKYSIKGMNNKKISVFAEHNDTVEFIFDHKVNDTFNKLGHLIEIIEMSDCFENVLHKGNNIKMNITLNKCK